MPTGVIYNRCMREGDDNLWDAGIRGVNRFMERWAARLPLLRSLRDAFRGGGDGFIDWERAEAIAVLVSIYEEAPRPPDQPGLQEEFEGIARRSAGLVEDFTGLRPGEELGPLLVLDRPAWIRANLSGFKLIFEPLSQSYRQALKRAREQRARPAGLGGRLTGGLLTAQIGMVMGYLSRNVLGQFDLGLPKLEDAGKLYIIYPNLVKAEEKMRLVPQDFRLWITLHEVTHAFEFAAFPWLREYMRRLMQDYFSSVSLQLEEMGRRVAPADLRDPARLNEMINRGGLISVIHTPEQREILDRIQAFMSLVEGYSNHVMDGVGSSILPSYREMKESFRRRRDSRSGAERFLQRVLGFDLKFQQYQAGELFCREVSEEEGQEFLNLAWKREENLPTYEEILHPFIWIDRIKGTEGKRVEHFHV
jgi:coenzyme F420 biosynthesis associated uncharacterized protein